MTTHPLRSLLFVPADDDRRISKALASAADAVILDLEDAVALSRKDEARRQAAGAVAGAGRPAIYVRINPATTPFCLADLQAIVQPGLAGVVLAKALSAEEVRCVAWTIEQLEQARGLTRGSLDLVPLIETAAGLLGAIAIGQADERVRRLAFGAADYTADIGVEWTPAEDELDHPRQMLVAASRAAGLEPPLDAPVLEFRDVERMRAAAARARAFGFQGKLCIHPAQIEPCHEAFAPTAEALARAARIVEAFEAAERSGIASIEVDGALVDYAVAVRARRVLASAG